MGSIPRTAESDDQRRCRVLQSEVDRLQELVQERIPQMRAADDNRAVPNSVLFAATILTRFQDVTMPRTTRSGYFGDEQEIPARDPIPEELMAVGAACQLLMDYFDRHNHRFQAGLAEAQRQLAAERSKPAKRGN